MNKKVRIKKETKSKSFKNKINKLPRLLADSPLPEIAFLTSLVLARWWLNSDFSYPSEIFVPFFMFAVLGCIIFYIYRAILGKGLPAHVASLLLSYGLYSYSFVHDSKAISYVLKIVPDQWSSAFTESIFLVVLLGILCGLAGWSTAWLVKKSKLLQSFQLYKIVLFAVLFVFSIQVFRFYQRYTEIHEALSYQYSAVSLDKPKQNGKEKPDIYYIVFDRYTNNDVIKNNFAYDNSDLTQFLKNQGFITRDKAYSNYPFTMSSISATLAMNYLPEFKDKFNKNGEWQADYPYRSIFNDPPIAQILKQNGYKYNQLSSWWDFSRVGVKADAEPTKSFRLSVLNRSIYLSDLQRDILNKSIFSPWLKKGVTPGDTRLLKYDLDRNPEENFNVQMQALADASKENGSSTPDFTFAHVLAPHPPYVFDENGNHPNYDPEANDNGVDEKIKYVNELKYINTRIKETLATIRTESPNAVIIIQADEGPYPKQFRGKITMDNYYDPTKLSPSDMQQKFGILASYYMPGIEKEEVKQINSSVNTFRFVLNNYLGYSLPFLPECNFSMGNKFSVYNYQLLTERLTGGPAVGACKKYE